MQDYSYRTGPGWQQYESSIDLGLPAQLSLRWASSVPKVAPTFCKADFWITNNSYVTFKTLNFPRKQTEKIKVTMIIKDETTENTRDI